MVPSVLGDSQNDATDIVQNAGLTYSLENAEACQPGDQGIVKDQNPHGRTLVKLRTNVILTVCPSLVVPDVTGEAEEKATSDLKDAGLEVSRQPSDPCSRREELGTVMLQAPDAETPISEGGKVTIYVCDHLD
jgi:beta-lactam-binding protein with PASTA domain